MTAINSRHWMTWGTIAFLFAAFQAPVALGQALYLGLDLNSPSHDIPPGYQGAERSKDLSQGFSVGWFSKSFFDGKGVTRVGFVFRRRELTTQAATLDPSEWYYRATSAQFILDRKLFLNRWLLLTGGAGFGLTFFTEEWENGDTSPDAWNLPDTCWIFSPGIRAAFHSDFPITAFVEARGTVYLRDNEVTFPFKSGVVFSLGAQLN